MNIDRSRFLVLTASLSAGAAGVGACSVAAPDGVPATPTEASTANDASAEAGGECSADAGEAAACQTFTGTLCAEQCGRVASSFGRGVSRAFAACIDDFVDCTSEGNGDMVLACLEGAMTAACPASERLPWCATFDNCGEGTVSRSACEGLVSALNESGYERFKACIDEGGGGCGPHVYPCYQNARYFPYGGE